MIVVQPLYATMLFNFLISVPWTFIFFLTQFLGIRLYYIKNRDECKKIQKKLGKYCSHLTDGGKGYGYSFGYWYLLSIESKNNYDYTVTMIATEESYKSLLRDDTIISDSITNTIEDDDETKQIHIYERCGSYEDSWFRKRKITFTLSPRPNQSDIIEKIKNHYDVHNHSVILIHGKPGRGKSIIGLFLANEYKSHYCNNLKPWQPGDSIADIVGDIEPSKQHPLIIMFDEFDGVIQKIHNSIPLHAKIPIAVPDKTGWNKLLDDIQLGLYPYIIIIMTSNSSMLFFNELDPSYLRPGRVDLIFEL
jgi:hypothetical protein